MNFSYNACITATGVLLSRLFGFLRDALIAWILGTGVWADALTAVLRIPYIGKRLLGDGSLSLPLTAACAAPGILSPNRLALYAARRAGIMTALCCTGLILFAPQIMHAIAPGLHTPDAVYFLRLCLPHLPLTALTAGCIAALYAADRYTVPALASSTFNICMIGAALAAYYYGLSAYEAASAVCVGVLIGGLAQLGIQILPVYRAARREAPLIRNKSGLSVITPIPNGVLAAAAPQLIFALAAVSASLLEPGAVSAMFYAERLLEFPIGLTAASIGIAAAPVLSSASNNSVCISTVITLALAASMPVVAGLAAVGDPLVRILFGHGACSARSTAMTAQFLIASLPCVLAYTVSRPLLTLCQVRHIRGITPLTVFSCIASATTGYFLIMHGHFLLAPAIAVNIGMYVQTAGLWFMSSRKVHISLNHRIIGLALSGSLAVYGTAAVVCTVLPSDIWAVTLAVPAGMAVFAVIMQPAWDELKGMIDSLR